MFPPRPPFSLFTVPHGCTLYYSGISGHAMPAPPTVGLTVTKVTVANFEAELRVIAALLQRYPVIVIDTEYPGTVHRPSPGRRESDLSPEERYTLVKANVDDLPIVQLGITLCDAEGKLSPETPTAARSSLSGSSRSSTLTCTMAGTPQSLWRSWRPRE